MPIGIIGSLVICTVRVVHRGVGDRDRRRALHRAGRARPHRQSGRSRRARDSSAASSRSGAIAGLTSVILVQLLGQSRVFYSMSRDGLLPPFVQKIHPRFRTPYITSIVTGLAVAIPAAILPVRDAAKLVSIGTLLAFVIVCTGSAGAEDPGAQPAPPVQDAICLVRGSRWGLCRPRISCSTSTSRPGSGFWSGSPSAWRSISSTAGSTPGSLPPGRN